MQECEEYMKPLQIRIDRDLSDSSFNATFIGAAEVGKISQQ